MVAAAFTIGQYAFTETGWLRPTGDSARTFCRAHRRNARQPDTAAFAMGPDRFARPGNGLVTLLHNLCCHYDYRPYARSAVGNVLVPRYPTHNRGPGSRIPSVFAGALIWYGPVTDSDSHVLAVVETVEAQGLEVLPNRVPGGSLISTYLQGNTRTPIQAEQYEKLISAFYSANHHFIKPFPDAGLAGYALRDASIPEPPVKWHLGYDTLALCLLIIEQLANLVAAVGALLMIVRRDSSVIVRKIGLLALATILLLTLLRFSGTLAVAYGQERAQLQGLVFLAITLCWAMDKIRWRTKGSAGSYSPGSCCLPNDSLF